MTYQHFQGTGCNKIEGDFAIQNMSGLEGIHPTIFSKI